jgi:hypothetical protein
VRGTDISSSLAYPGEAPLTLVIVRLIANRENEKFLKEWLFSSFFTIITYLPISIQFKFKRLVEYFGFFNQE